MPDRPAAFYEQIQRRARLSSVAEAHQVAATVVRSLGRVLGGRASGSLRAALPADLTGALPDAAVEPDETVDGQLFIGPLVADMDTEYGYDATLGGMDLVSAYADDDAATRVAAVFGALKARVDGATREEVATSLPPPMRDWWRRA